MCYISDNSNQELVMLNKYKIDNDVLIVYTRKDNREMICDVEDYDIISKHTWYLGDGYVMTAIKDATGKQKMLYLHRLLMNPPDGMAIDHINGIKHDNRKANLRIVTSQVNNHNRQSAKGYSWNKKAGKYSAQITLNKKKIYLGLYNTAAEARIAYLDAKKLYHPTAPVNAE